MNWKTKIRRVVPSFTSFLTLSFYVGQAFLTTACPTPPEVPLGISINSIGDAAVSVNYKLYRDEKHDPDFATTKRADRENQTNCLLVPNGPTYLPLRTVYDEDNGLKFVRFEFVPETDDPNQNNPKYVYNAPVYPGRYTLRVAAYKHVQFKKTSDPDSSYVTVPHTLTETLNIFDYIAEGDDSSSYQGTLTQGNLTNDVEYTFRFTQRVIEGRQTNLSYVPVVVPADYEAGIHDCDTSRRTQSRFDYFRSDSPLTDPKFIEDVRASKTTEYSKPNPGITYDVVPANKAERVYYAKATPRAVPKAFAITAVTPGYRALTLTWGNSQDANYYDVLYRFEPAKTWTEVKNVTSPYEITGLEGGVKYVVSVRAKNIWDVKENKFNEKGPNEEKSATTLADPVPGAFAISTPALGSGEVTLTWPASSGAASYNLKYGTATGNYGTTVTGVTSPYTVTSLANGTTYYFMVEAVNQYGTTNATAEVTGVPVPPPDAFTITGTTAGNAQVALTWAASTNATSYEVKYGVLPGVYTSVFGTTTGTSTTVTGLTNGLTYYFMVTAKNPGVTTTNATSETSATPVPPVPGGRLRSPRRPLAIPK